MIYNNLQHKKGFTLVELMISIAIGLILIGLIVTLYAGLVRARIKQQVIADVESQGVLIMNTITQIIRNAQDINSPIPNQTLAALSVKTYLASTTPTVFDLSSSTIRMTEGSSAVVPLSNNEILISNLTFQNLALTALLDSIKIQFTITHATTTNGRNDFNYSKTFYGLATVRRFQ